ncbi:YxlC family protein [Halalkalibacter hemicellulosilyticus]|uniref:Uncharacterized protein n=1 Tax=Halalkalibacter hemicellulosilyticusJCM 9152 TaxID=1236971 RepID=W4QGV3_9BACI|nr:YxlC family protein [Halalkalibacter hemicellulosilyticus]GAE30559.1 hypothetical protein JCM9152_1969 [Halalkalibacter hemicellulosilyticusJCM 9152]
MSEQDKDRHLVQSLKADWKKLDQIGDEWIDSAYLEQQIQQAQKEKQRAMKKEFYLFLVSSVFIMIATIAVIHQSFHAFIIIQCVTLVGAPLILFLLNLRKKKKKVTA